MGRAVLVTGASRGIGRAIARRFASNGDTVAVHCNSRSEDAEATLSLLAGTGHRLVQGDLTDPEVVARIVRESAGEGGLGVLVNNAAIMEPHPIAVSTYEHWQQVWTRTLHVNLVAAANASYCAAQSMIRSGRPGSIVNVASRGAFRGEPDHPAYGASKAALVAMGQSLAIALAPHDISVTSVAPGFIETERVAPRLTGEEANTIREQSPFGRVGTPDEVAAAVLYLASPEALWSSGTVVDVNGASHLRM